MTGKKISMNFVYFLNLEPSQSKACTAYAIDIADSLLTSSQLVRQVLFVHNEFFRLSNDKPAIDDQTPPHLQQSTPPTGSRHNSFEMANERSGLILGLNKGHKTSAIEKRPRISRRKGALSRRTAFVREIVKEVAGLAPYERRVIELLRNSQDKRARKLAKKRLGTFGRAKRKVDEMQKVIAEARRTGAH
ncbi:60S ribosomal protein [Coccidioides immitis RMSCC 2394]|nr:60S ribosomal protein [Coccidioides immitis RMSCC 2394]